MRIRRVLADRTPLAARDLTPPAIPLQDLIIRDPVPRLRMTQLPGTALRLPSHLAAIADGRHLFTVKRQPRPQHLPRRHHAPATPRARLHAVRRRELTPADWADVLEHDRRCCPAAWVTDRIRPRIPADLDDPPAARANTAPTWRNVVTIASARRDIARRSCPRFTPSCPRGLLRPR